MSVAIIALAALAGAALVAGIAVRRLPVARIAMLVAGGVIGWLVLMEVWQPAAFDDAVRRLITAGVTIAWYLLIQDAVKHRRED